MGERSDEQDGDRLVTFEGGVRSLIALAHEDPAGAERAGWGAPVRSVMCRPHAGVARPPVRFPLMPLTGDGFAC